MKFKKLLCAALSTILAVSVIPFSAIPLAATDSTSKISFTAEVLPSSAAFDVSLHGNNTGHEQTSDTDVVAMQFVLTDQTTAISTTIPSYSNNTGSVTMALFAFDKDYDTSLLSAPLAEYTFVDFKDGSKLTFVFPETAPLPAGEYILVIYDMKDDTPTADGGANGTGIGLWVHAPHEGQRTYMNGSYVGDRSFPLYVSYAGDPQSLYGTPTKPAVSTDIDYSPHMDAVLDFRNEDTMSYIGGGNQTTASFETEDGVSFLRLKAAKDAGDPYQYINFPDTIIKCNEYNIALLKVRRTEGSTTQSQLFFTTDEQGVAEAASVRPNYQNTTDWQYLIVNLGANNKYSGLLKTFRLDYFQSCEGTQHLDVQYIALFKTQEAAEAFHDHFDDFSTGNDDENMATDPTQNPDYSTYISSDTPASPTDGKLTENGQLGYLYKEYPFTMDFEDGKTPADYMAEGGYAFSAIDNAIPQNGQLHCKAFSSYEFYTKKFLGDAYGIRGGALSFDMALESGEISVTLRQLKANDDYKYSGIRFTLTADGTITVSERDGLTDTVKLSLDLSKEQKYVFADNGSTMTLTIDGEEVYTLAWDSVTKTLTTPSGESFSAIHVADAGYAAFRATRTRGYLDNISYTYIDIVSMDITGEHPVDYSTWVAIDDLGRVTPTNETAGDAQEKYVGLFYFMIHSDDMSSRYVNDVTRFYLEGGTDNVSSKLSSFAGRNGAYWAEPYFGYYSSHDTWVYRKHAYMLDAAGVDFIFLDVSNNRFYVEQCKVLFDTWKSIRDEGGQTPQICFMYGDMPFTLLNGLYTLLEPFYNNPDYQELLFCWEGKPLLLGNSDTPDGKTWTVSGTTPQTKAQYRQYLNENPALKAFYENEYTTLLSERFTVRKCWAWQAGTNKGYWDWLQESPQSIGTNPQGRREQMSVSMGVHAHTSKGRSYLNSDSTYNPEGQFGFTLDTSGSGLFFEEQFNQVRKYKDYVQVMMITGWNEWYAGVHQASQNQTCGQTATPGYYMVDQMSPEYSRDGEPMKLRDGVGFGDNYYYQMVSYIREFKGIDKAPETVNGGSMLTADTTAWEKISPAFTDTVGDTDLRSSASFCYEFLYTNGTARNDLDVAKVSQDADYLYFHITTATPLITVDDELWMNLYVNTDNDATTGWEGFDFIINRSRTDKTVSVERFLDGQWSFEAVGDAEYLLGDNALTIKVSKDLLGYSTAEAVSLSFKWADNADVRGDIMRFMELGDTAPNDRFVFTYTASTNEDERPTAEEQPSDSEESTDTDTTPIPDTDTDTDTEPATSPETLPDAATEQESATSAETSLQTTTEEDTGCASVSACASLACLAVGAAVLATKRRKKKETD